MKWILVILIIVNNNNMRVKNLQEFDSKFDCLEKRQQVDQYLRYTKRYKDFTFFLQCKREFGRW